jgi:hypothetical protein
MRGDKGATRMYARRSEHIGRVALQCNCARVGPVVSTYARCARVCSYRALRLTVPERNVT